MQPSLTGQQQTSVAVPSPLIQVEHLSRVIGSHARKTMILDDITFNVPAESLFAIMGFSA